jgi:hypothetical protein
VPRMSYDCPRRKGRRRGATSRDDSLKEEPGKPEAKPKALAWRSVLKC